MTQGKKIQIAVFALGVLTACSTAIHMGDRQPAQYANGALDKPSGLVGQDESDFNHLSEGSEIYPYEWMKVLKSESSHGPFLDDLEGRFGISPSRNQGPYLMPYEGLTAAWSASDPKHSDAFRSDASLRVRELDGVKSIKMVGTNCVLCHSGEIQYNGKSHRIDGAPNIANIRGFFEDLASSTVATLAQPKALTQFMSDLRVPNAHEQAKELSHSFLVELGLETGRGWGAFSGKYTLAKAKLLNDRRRYFKGKKALGNALLKLLKITYGFKDTDQLGELPERMKFLGTLMVGTDPKTEETPSGYGRTDAFGRIGNLILRDENPIGYTAPVSLPWIWGIKYEAMLHYTANTNSVMLRNIGQSLGLGSIILDQSGHSTSNLFNLDRLEHLAHKIKVPMWEEVFADEPSLKVDHTLAKHGRDLYEAKCKHCHETNKRVGKTFALYDYKVLPLDKIGTDPIAAENIIVPVKGQEFRNAIFGGVENVKSAFYRENQIPESQQLEMEFFSLRGTEFFRDTLKGFNLADQESLHNNYGQIPAGSGYKARHLSGVWATAPYLHNGSVPTIWDLLQPASKRPLYFNVKSRQYDPIRLGYVSSRPVDLRGNPKPCGAKEVECFDATDKYKGNLNTGHDFTSEYTDEDRMAVIEYLKILPPEPEYAW